METDWDAETCRAPETKVEAAIAYLFLAEEAMATPFRRSLSP